MNGTEEETTTTPVVTTTTPTTVVVVAPEEPAVVEDDVVQFVLPPLQSNPDGWGPVGVPDQFKDMPYQPFSKSDRIGKVRFSLFILSII